MNQLQIFREIRSAQQQLRDLEEGYKLGLYDEQWYNEHVNGLKSVIEAKKALYKDIYDIHKNI